MELICNFIKHFLTIPVENIKAIPSAEVVDATEENVIGRAFFYSYRGCLYLITVTNDMIYVDSFPKRSQLRLNVNRETCVYSVDNPELIITSDMIKFTKLLTKIY